MLSAVPMLLFGTPACSTSRVVDRTGRESKHVPAQVERNPLLGKGCLEQTLFAQTVDFAQGDADFHFNQKFDEENSLRSLSFISFFSYDLR